ncbi:MAG: tRNA pseudouridine(38-40) synthase TruA [Clostridia bacterium]|nr:tRNA pseudouridine(38-40) synthase TruA [Clostridia bacterium]
MRNIMLTIAYDGKDYHGWQYQDNAMSIQEVMTKALKKIFKKKININGCSRTDARVHANRYVANFKIENDIDCESIIRALNSVLPKDISALSACEVAEDFHARYSTFAKEYIYKVYDGKIRDPFLRDYAYFWRYRLDDKLLNEQAKDFIGVHDFKSFCASGSKITETTREVLDASVERQGNLVIFRFKARAFLYNMVRIMVGTLLYINAGQIKKGSIPSIIESKNRILAGKTVPPQGLYLNRVFYGEENESN